MNDKVSSVPGLFLGSRLPPLTAPMGFGRHHHCHDERGGDIVYTSDAPLVTIAPTGSGKTTGAVIPSLLTWPGPAVVVDPKGEVCAVTAAARRRMGQKVLRIDPFGIADAAEAQCASLNPLDLIDDSPNATDEAVALSQSLTPASISSDPFWDISARQIMTGALLWVALHAPPHLKSIDTVQRLFAQGNEGLAAFLGAMKIERKFDGRIAESANQLLSLPDKTFGSVLSSIRAALNFLSSPGTRAGISSGNAVDLADLTGGAPMTLYLVLPPDKLDSHSKLLRVWMTTIIRTLAMRKHRPPMPTLLMVDEAAQLGPLDELRVAITLLRGQGVQVWTHWQSLAQIQHLYPDWRTLIENAGIIQAFGAATAMSAAAIQSVTGYEGEILGLRHDEQILSMAGLPAIRARRPNYLTDLRYQGQFRPNPLFAPQIG
ncbi:Putative TraG/TraD family protein [Magnetospirillum gryphiswaldense MSR-1 v2]|uniref:TraG/TraD family protein n=1 Tax=Magnetospirillum gryphiswaldense (strain DSM 6361 / JCM 21280 / NBRC 15271 / MSR-1) TaxID=431944 RepID=V6F642_MAGGM|nr:Putative TraG/TraD family protein [Magnetospirillum gryphiswaldense MSR-1 v2]